MKNKTPITLIDLLAAGGNGSDKSGLITCTWIGKNCAMVACRRDNFSTKVPGYVSADGATNVYSLNRRAVSVNKVNLYTLIISDFDNYISSCLFRISVFVP
jgi:hypothetical protein